MKTVAPDYYPNFKCIASECRHNCCIGWEIDIDEDTFEYYKGLIRLRKAHPVLRMSAVYDILSNLVPVDCDNPHVLAFQLSGNIPAEPADEMFIVFNAAETAVSIDLPKGKWQICVDSEHAGTESLGTAEENVTISPISAMVLIKGSLK